MIGRRLPFDLWVQHDDMGNAPHLMPTDERDRVFEQMDWYRAGGDCVCTCGKIYYDHRNVLGAMWLTRLCDNTFVKL